MRSLLSTLAIILLAAPADAQQFAGAMVSTPSAAPPQMIANVLSFGADPTGKNDSTAAFKAAIANGPNAGNPTTWGEYPLTCVYVPAGTYKITNAVTLPPLNGCLYGDGRTLSTLEVYSTSFNMDAPGVVVVQNSLGATASEVHDIGIQFWQPDTTSRANLVLFPPGIYAHDAGRAHFRNLRIGGGGPCIDARGNAGGSVFDTIECGALTTGLLLGSNPINPSADPGSLDGVHIKSWHFWDFGLDGNTGLIGLFCDGNAVSMQIGHVDWLGVDDSQNFCGTIHYLSEASGSADPHQWTNLSLDTGALWFEGGQVQISNLQGGAAINPVINLSGAGNPQVFVRNAWIVNGPSGGSPIQLTAGNLEIDGGNLSCANNSTPCASVDGGALSLEHMIFGPTTGAWTAPYLKQISGPMRLEGNFFISPGGGVNVGVYYTTDTLWNWFSPISNQMNGWTWTMPTSGASADSYYGQGVVTMPTGQATLTLTALDGVSSAGVILSSGGYGWAIDSNSGGMFSINNGNGNGFTLNSDGHITFGQNLNVTNENIGSLKVDQTLTISAGALYLAQKTVAQLNALSCNGGDVGAIFVVTDLSTIPVYYGIMGTGGGSSVSIVQCDGANWRNH